LSVNHPQPLQPTNLKQTAQPTSKPEPTQKTKHTKQHSPQEVVVLRKNPHLLQEKKPKKQTKGKNKE
jgi:DNA-binding transcriptional regulator YiaG